MTTIGAYASILTNLDEVKDKFYKDLNILVTRVPTRDKLVILGDFNARVGCDSDSWDGVIGKHGVGKCNSNSLLLLQTCAKHNLLITSTIFRLSTSNKTSWMQSRSKHWHLIDYVIVKTKHRQDVHVMKALCGAECWADHRLIISKLNLRIQPLRRPQSKKTLRRLAIDKLNSNDVKQVFIDSLDKQLKSMSLLNLNVENAGQHSARQSTTQLTSA